MVEIFCAKNISFLSSTKHFLWYLIDNPSVSINDMMSSLVMPWNLQFCSITLSFESFSQEYWNLKRYNLISGCFSFSTKNLPQNIFLKMNEKMLTVYQLCECSINGLPLTFLNPYHVFWTRNSNSLARNCPHPAIVILNFFSVKI